MFPRFSGKWITTKPRFWAEFRIALLWLSKCTQFVDLCARKCHPGKPSKMQDFLEMHLKIPIMFLTWFMNEDLNLPMIPDYTCLKIEDLRSFMILESDYRCPKLF